jgi:hypothetical protein
VRVCRPTAILFALIGALDQHPAYAGERCDQVVSYFRSVPGGSPEKREWRIFDPSRRTDVLFLTLPGGFDGVRWDTTFSVAWFSSGLELYRVDWKLGAKPVRIGPLPRVDELQGWWFNPDSSRWQADSDAPDRPGADDFALLV